MRGERLWPETTRAEELGETLGERASGTCLKEKKSILYPTLQSHAHGTPGFLVPADEPFTFSHLHLVNDKRESVRIK